MQAFHQKAGNKLTPKIIMKYTYKMITGVFFLALTLNSCSNDQQENEDLNALEQELLLENKGFLEIGSTTYVFRNTGETVKFVETARQFDFVFTNEIVFKAASDVSKHTDEDFIYTNPQTNEFVRIHNVEVLKNRNVKFDVEFSTGQKLSSVISGPNASANAGKWHKEPYFASHPEILSGLMEKSQISLSSDCTSAIDICSKAGGNASVQLNKGGAWFTTPETCQVVCNQ